jgi:cell division septation protein DedD
LNSLIDNIENDEEHHSRRGEDREITLGTTMILLIFFALAVYGAVLFGFGYSMGSKHSGGTAIAAEPASSATFNSFKPAPGSPVGSTGEKLPPNNGSTVPYTPPSATKSVPVEDEPARSNAPDPDDIISNPPRPKPGAQAVIPPAPATTAPAAAVTPAAPGVPTGPAVVVQIAAVSHQEDADLIATTLRRRGYVVNIRTEPDKLLHVQVGPFTNRKDAEAMKAKLLADGFNAYIK